jgi:hypothetical protein
VKEYGVTFVFLFDAFDEIVERYDVSRDLFSAFGLRSFPNAQCVVSVRGGVLSQSERAAVFGQSQATIHLCPFGPERVDQYLRLFVRSAELNAHKWSYAKLNAVLSQFDGLREMMSSPFLMRTVVTILPQLSAQSGATRRAQVYAAFLSEWFERESRKIVHRAKVDETASLFEWHNQKLALAMWTRALSKVNTGDELWTRFFGDASYGLSARTLLKGSVLKAVGGHAWAFIHKSCSEFLIAMRIVDELCIAMRIVDELCSRDTLSDLKHGALPFALNATLLNSEPSAIAFIADRVKEGLECANEYAVLPSRLFAIVGASKTDATLWRASSNAASILNASRIPLSGCASLTLCWTMLCSATLTSLTLTSPMPLSDTPFWTESGRTERR